MKAAPWFVKRQRTRENAFAAKVQREWTYFYDGANFVRCLTKAYLTTKGCLRLAAKQSGLDLVKMSISNEDPRSWADELK